MEEGRNEAHSAETMVEGGSQNKKGRRSSSTFDRISSSPPTATTPLKKHLLHLSLSPSEICILLLLCSPVIMAVLTLVSPIKGEEAFLTRSYSLPFFLPFLTARPETLNMGKSTAG